MLKKSFVFISLFLFFASVAFATIPKKINYQGYLTDSGGTPVTTTTPLEMTLSIYSSETTTTFLWQATYKVNITEGRFNLLLGDPDYLSVDKEIPYSVFDGSVKYLGIKVGTDPEMTPRKKLTSVAYSYKAQNSQQLNGKESFDFVQKLNNVAPNTSGNIDLVQGSNITISPDDANNKITISAASPSGDNLGNHTATQNIKLNNNWLSNDGGNEGLKVDNSGNIIAGNKIEAKYLEGIGTSQSGVSGKGATYGVYGNHSSGNYGYLGSSSNGVYGEHSNGYYGILGYVYAGVYGNSSYNGVYGYCNSNGSGVNGYSKDGAGVSGSCSGNYGYIASPTMGVYGRRLDNYGVLGATYYGVYGFGVSSNSHGVYGYSSSNYGVYGKTTTGYAGYFDGKVRVKGYLYKDGGGFEIDHPLDPENKYLYHSFVESPDMKNVYDGIVVLDAFGEATVELPDWFDVLNKDFRYQLTAIGAPGPNIYIAEKITNNRFKIAGGTSGMEVSWQITGIRQDVYAKTHRIQVEVEKEGKERGKYLTPKEHGMPETLGIDYEETKRMEEEQKMVEQEHQRKIEEDKRMEDERQRMMEQLEK